MCRLIEIQNTVQLSDIEARIQARDFYNSGSAEVGSQVYGTRSDKMGGGVKVRIDVIRQREEAMQRSIEL